jgi:prefoldin alpha subunit
MSSSSEDDLQDQLSYYLRFVETILKPKLEKAEIAANIVREEITNYEELVTRMKATQTTSTTTKATTSVKDESDSNNIMVDIGHKTIYCNATVKDLNKIFVHVGMGFHVELNPTEASEFATKRIIFLRASSLQEKEVEITEIKDHIQSATIILDQLYTEMKKGETRFDDNGRDMNI